MKTKNAPLESFDFSDKKMAVLLIDNNVIDLLINRKLFEIYGVTNVHCVRNGNDALLHLKETSVIYHVILIDIYLPFMDGFEFLDKFTELGLNKKHGKICLLSASVNPLDKEKADERNVIFMEKPLNIEKILKTK